MSYNSFKKMVIKYNRQINEAITGKTKSQYQKIIDSLDIGEYLPQYNLWISFVYNEKQDAINVSLLYDSDHIYDDECIVLPIVNDERFYENILQTYCNIAKSVRTTAIYTMIAYLNNNEYAKQELNNLLITQVNNLHDYIDKYGENKNCFHK